MIKKLLLFVFAITLVACSSSKPVVRTTKNSYPKPRTQVAQANRKPVVKPTISKNGSENPQERKTVSASNPSNSTEVLEATTRVKVTTQMVLDYIDRYKDIAKENMINNGIPSSITLGQAILESGAGTGPLSIQANNHFGIKCHKEWNGPSIKHTDDAENECFRKYDDPNQSFKDHSFFLTSRPRYATLFQLGKSDYKAWAKGLKAAGYATDPKYPEKLIGLIERYQLDRFDSEVLGKEYAPIVYNNLFVASNDVHQVVKGDTLYSISKKYNLTVEELKKKNNLSDSAISLGQSLIIK
jgi:flagellum-specific peptidoglycan hydrolase FlgJ